MNSAQRLLKIYDSLMSISPSNNQNMTQVWSTIFGLNSNEPDTEDKVVSLLSALRKQIDNTRTKLNKLDVPAELTEPGFGTLKSTASTSYLNTGFSSLIGNIQARECRQAFMWSAWVLKAENESELTDADLIELLKELDELEQNIINTNMSDDLRSFLLEKIDEIKQALFLTKVQGTAAVDGAVAKIWGAITIQNQNLSNDINATDETKSIVKTFMEKFYKFAEFGDNLENFTALGKQIGNVAGFLADMLPK